MCYIKIGEPISHLEVVNYKCQCDLNLGEVCIECGWHFAIACSESFCLVTKCLITDIIVKTTHLHYAIKHRIA